MIENGEVGVPPARNHSPLIFPPKNDVKQFICYFQSAKKHEKID